MTTGKIPVTKKSWYAANEPLFMYWGRVVKSLLGLVIPALLGFYILQSYGEDFAMALLGTCMLVYAGFCLVSTVMVANAE